MPLSVARAKGLGAGAALGLLLGAAAGAAAAVSSGKYTTLSFKTEGGRGAAMGDAQTAAVEGVDAVFWNPAALSRLYQDEVGFMHDRSFDSVNQDVVNYAHPMEQGVVGAGLTFLRMNVPGYDDDGNRGGDLSASDTLATLSWGQAMEPMPFVQNLRVGGSLKFFDKKLGENSAYAFLGDVGLIHEVNGGVLQGLKTGLLVQNLGTSMTFLSERSTVAPAVKLGWAMPFLSDMTAAADLVFASRQDPQVHMGLEYRPKEFLALRLGGVSGRNLASGLTYGLGFGSGRLRLDYAFVPEAGVGGSHRLSVGFRFGEILAGAPVDGRAEALYRDAVSLFNAGEYEPALTMFQAVAVVNAEDSRAKGYITLTKDRLAERAFNEGDAAARSGSWPRAMGWFRKALTLRPEFPEARAALAKTGAWLREEDCRRAAALYERGLMALISGDDDTALDLWRAALEKDPDNVNAQDAVAEILKKRQRPGTPGKPREEKK